MSLLDSVQDVFRRVLPPKQSRIPSASGPGIGGGGHGLFEDDEMIVSKATIVLHSTQIFFNFLAMCCFASVAAFQSHWEIGVSGLSGFALFVTISGMLLSAFMLMVPVVYEKYDKLARLARGLKEIRVGFILSGYGTLFSLLIAFIVTISAWTQPGCKNPDNDPHNKNGKEFKNALSGWCNTKKAAAIFLWLAFIGWAGTLALTVRDWRRGATTRPRDPAFHPPQMASEDYAEDDRDSIHPGPKRDQADAELVYEPIPPIRRQTDDDLGGALRSPFGDENRYGGGGGGYGGAPAAGRPSMEAYGAFSDPAPSGYGGAGQAAMPSPGVSRTMQYADPYAAVRASIGSGGPTSTPPNYENYSGYR